MSDNNIEERKFGRLTVRIDRDTCIGSDNCTALAPEVFELDEDSVVSFRSGGTEIEPERLVEACDLCPVDALTVIDESGERIVPRG